MGRPPSPTKSIHTAVRLPPDLHERLSRAGRGALADEIKKRLEVSFWWDDMDPSTRDLLAAILHMAGLIHGDTGAAWHSNAYLRAALAEAIAAFMAERVPGDTNAPSSAADASVHASAAWLHEGDIPQVAGKKLVGLYKLLRAPNEAVARYQERLRTNPLLRDAHQPPGPQKETSKRRKKP